MEMGAQMYHQWLQYRRQRWEIFAVLFDREQSVRHEMDEIRRE